MSEEDRDAEHGECRGERHDDGHLTRPSTATDESLGQSRNWNCVFVDVT